MYVHDVGPDTLGRVLDLLSANADPDTLDWRYWQTVLSSGKDHAQVTKVAIQDDRATGTLVVEHRPLVHRRGRLVRFLISPGDIGLTFSTLIRATASTCRHSGIDDLFVSVMDGDDPTRARVEAEGFHPFSQLNCYAGDLDWIRVEPIDGIDVDLYEGTDPAIDAQIATLANRLLRREQFWVPLTPDDVRSYAASTVTSWHVAYETRSRTVIGVIESILIKELVNFVAVARRHWGTGLAALLSQHTSTHAASLGVRQLTSVVAPANAPSHSLNRRMAGQLVGQIHIYRKTLSDP